MLKPCYCFAFEIAGNGQTPNLCTALSKRVRSKVLEPDIHSM